MLSHEFEEAASGRISIKGMDAAVFEQILKFMYTGKIDPCTLREHGEALYRAADQYSINHLFQLCEKQLLKNATAGNALVMYDLAGNRSDSPLAKKSFEIMLK